jgi:hypothetical protein
MGIEPATFGATIRCNSLQSVLVCPVIWGTYGVFGNFAEHTYPLGTSLY